MTLSDPPQLDNLLGRLDGVRRAGRGWTARCPSHAVRRPSLSIGVGRDGRVLLRCMAGCPTGDVLASLGMTSRDLFAGDDRPLRWSRFVAFGKSCRKPTRRPDPPPDPPTIDLLPWCKRWHAAGRDRLAELAERLGVAEAALVRLRVGVATRAELAGLSTACRADDATTWPMRDGHGRIVGVRLRSPDGFKWAVAGGRQGLFVPHDPPDRPDTLYVVEGASDVAALLTTGLAAVGLPSAGQGGALLVDYVRRTRPGRVVLLADGDPAGERGADTVARELATAGIACRVAGLPGDAKDARDYLRAGGTADALRELATSPAEGTVMP